jgi:hypothetical protein
MQFYTNSAERMRIDSSGNVGIGTSSPNYQLHVTTSMAVGASGFNQQLSFTNDTIQSLLLGTGYTALKLNPLGGGVTIGTANVYSSGKLTVVPTTNPTTSTSVNNQIFIGESSQNSSYYMNLGYINSAGSGYVGSIQSVSGGTPFTLLLNAAGGNVGIGTEAPDALLHIYKTSGKVATFGNNVNNNGNYIVLAGSISNKNWVISNNMLVGGEFGIGRTSAAGGTTIGSAHDLMINSSGTVGIGVTPSAWGTSIIALEGYTGGGSSWSIASGGALALAMIISNNCYYNGSNWIYKATDPASSYYQYAGSHYWRTVSSGSAGTAITWTEAMILNASGYLLVNSPSQVLSYHHNIRGGTNNGLGMMTLQSAYDTNISHSFGPNSNGAFVIYRTPDNVGVYLGWGNTSWTANSDERNKDIIEPILDAVNKVSSLRAVIGKYKTDNEGTRRSFLIAQDVQKVLPEAVDATNPDNLGVQYTEVIPLLVAAIKEQQALIESLTSRLTALEGK